MYNQLASYLHVPTQPSSFSFQDVKKAGKAGDKAAPGLSCFFVVVVVVFWGGRIEQVG